MEGVLGEVRKMVYHHYSPTAVEALAPNSSHQMAYEVGIVGTVKG